MNLILKAVGVLGPAITFFSLSGGQMLGITMGVVWLIVATIVALPA